MDKPVHTYLDRLYALANLRTIIPPLCKGIMAEQ